MAKKDSGVRDGKNRAGQEQEICGSWECDRVGRAGRVLVLVVVVVGWSREEYGRQVYDGECSGGFQGLKLNATVQ